MERIFLSPPCVGERERASLLEAFNSNYIAPVGPFLNRFEEVFCEKTGFNHCCAVSSGTAAIHLGLRGLGVAEGDVVIGSTLTFIGSVSPISFQNAEIVLVDSDKETWTMDPDLLSSAIFTLKKENRRIGAILPTDLYGQSCDLGRILSVAEQEGIPVLTDSAEALGATYGEASVGKAASAAAFSFNGNKILTTSGGGVLASDDSDLIEQARFLSTQAKEPVPHFEHKTIGYNYRLSNLLAAVGVGQLEQLEEMVSRRREIFARYSKNLGGVDGISFMPQADYGQSNCWLTVILVDEKKFGVCAEEVRLHLEAENIESRPMWKPMHLQPVFENCRVFGCEVSEELFDSGLCLPSGTQLEDSQVDRISELIRSAGK